MHVPTRRRQWAVLLALAFVPREALAQTGYHFLATSLIVPNYAQIPVGEWEALESGAYVARTHDGNSNWYNPSGLALAARTAVNASANAYEASRLEFDTFTNTDRTMRFAGLGGFFGVAIAEPISRSPNVRYGFYVARPLAWTSGTVNGMASIDPQTEVRLISSGDLAGTEPGIAAGLRLGDRVRVGASAGVAIANLSEAMDVNVRRVEADSVRALRGTLSQEGSAWYAVARGGLQWDATERLSVGLVLSSPGLRITGSTKFDYTFTDHSPTRLVDERFRDTEADFDYRIPFNVAAGVGAQFDRGEVEVAVRHHGSTPLYDMISTGVAAQRVEQVDGGLPIVTAIVPEPLRNEWRAVTNVAVGGNFILNDLMRVHLGFQTDRSPVSDQGNVLFRKIDLYGGTAGVSFNGKSFTGTVGLGFSTGQSHAMRSSIANEQPTETRARLTTIRGMYSLAVRF